jgi:hypothetical protein
MADVKVKVALAAKHHLKECVGLEGEAPQISAVQPVYPGKSSAEQKRKWGGGGTQNEADKQIELPPSRQTLDRGLDTPLDVRVGKNPYPCIGPLAPSHSLYRFSYLGS